jgi:hypothetical protein
MVQVQVSLTTLAAILWCGMLVIAGSIWVLASQVRRVADVIDRHASRAEIPIPTSLRHVERQTPRPLPNAQARLDEVYGSSLN